MQPTTPGLTPLQIDIANSIAAGVSITAAAQAAGLNRSTIHYWMRTITDFAIVLNQARLERLDGARDVLYALQVQALTCYKDLLTDKETPPSVLLKAVLALLQDPKTKQITIPTAILSP